MAIGSDDHGAGAGGEAPQRVTRVVLVAVEVVCDPGAVERVEMVATQWSQDLRFRHIAGLGETTAAVAVSLPGSLHTLADALRAAHDGLR